MTYLNDKTVKKIFSFFRRKYPKYSNEIEEIELISLWQAEKTYNSNKSNFYTYLTAVHRNKVYSLTKKISKSKEQNVVVEKAYNDSTLFQLENTESAKKLLETLSEREKYIMVKRFWKDETFEEIAKSLAVSTQCVHQTYHTALNKMKEIG